MLKVTIEIIPNSNPSDTKTIGECVIVNDETGSKTSGNYEYRLYRGNEVLLGRVERFHRPRGAWSLLGEVLVKSGAFLPDEGSES